MVKRNKKSPTPQDGKSPAIACDVGAPQKAKVGAITIYLFSCDVGLFAATAGSGA
jgi:hypothetical protein